jgi:hypothetical protein
MATTKRKIAEQVQRLLRGNPIISARTHINDVKLLIEQVANQLLKADHFGVNMPEGDTVPNNAMIFTYDNVAVATYKTTRSKCLLPSIPISLPRNVGVLHISKTDAIDEPFIPIPSSLYGIVKPQDLLGDLSGSIQMWSTSQFTFENENTLKEHNDSVSDLVFLNNGYLVSTSFNKTIKIWDNWYFS